MLTSEKVANLWRFMQQQYNTTVVDKRSAPEMLFASKFLAAGFLDKYATTIGKRIYLPFTPGVENASWSLLGQAKICAHEHQHVEQLNRERFKYLSSYIFDSSARARYETEAYVCNLEVQYALTGEMQPAHELADRLKDYGLLPGQRVEAYNVLTIASTEIGKGKIHNRPSQLVIDFLSK